MRRFLYKFIIIGDTAVGKSSLLVKYIDKSFVINYVPTIGVDLRSKKIEYSDIKIKINIWDIAGNEAYQQIVSPYYKNVHAVIVMFDLSNPSTFENVKYWLENIKTNCNSEPVIVLVGNKSDLPHNNYQMDIKFFNIFKYYEISVKTDTDTIDKIFTELIEKIQSEVERKIKQRFKVPIFSLEDRSREKKRCCCQIL